MSVIVFADTRGEKVAKNALETLTYGRKIAAKEGTSLTLVTFGDAPADRLAALDANKVVVARSIGDAVDLEGEDFYGFLVTLDVRDGQSQTDRL